ncbi:hypothetical protein [Pseudoalteromonas sp. B160]|uniref:hypothetical protein n=1 Tax=Pseudoalteromonas sp. B160 TaxID=630414 RepID=UPI00301C3BD4
MTQATKNLSLETALNTKIRVSFDNGIASSDGGIAVYFDALLFNDDIEVIYLVRGGEFCGSFQVLPQEYLKLKEEAKALNLIT